MLLPKCKHLVTYGIFLPLSMLKTGCTSSLLLSLPKYNQSKPCTQVYFQKFENCINLQLAIRISKNHAFRTCTTPLRTFMLILRSIGLLDIEIPQKLFPQTDGRTDRRTDGRTDVARQQKGSFFRKKEKLLKNE